MIGLYDIHCHILPGVDDGSKDVETSLEMLRREYEDGVRNVILTPHFRRNMFETTTEEIGETFKKFRVTARNEGIKINLYLGREQYIDSGTKERLMTRPNQTLAGSRYVLCEFSYETEYDFIRERTTELRSSGFIPLIAHVERYKALRGKYDNLDELKELGCYIQINAGSIIGNDGLLVKHFCKKAIQYDLLDFIGSDAHNLTDRKPCIGECALYLEKHAGRKYTRRIMQENPQMIIDSIKK